MMPVMSIAVDAILAGLMVALIVYCVKLNRRLAALRDNDAEIRQMIVELRNAADRADAATNVLKAAGIEAERSLRAQVQRAEAMRDGLGAALNSRMAASPRDPGNPPAASTRPAAVSLGDEDIYTHPAPLTRRVAENEMLKAIRVARTEG